MRTGASSVMPSGSQLRVHLHVAALCFEALQLLAAARRLAGGTSCRSPGASNGTKADWGIGNSIAEIHGKVKDGCLDNPSTVRSCMLVRLNPSRTTPSPAHRARLAAILPASHLNSQCQRLQHPVRRQRREVGSDERETNFLPKCRASKLPAFQGYGCVYVFIWGPPHNVPCSVAEFWFTHIERLPASMSSPKPRKGYFETVASPLHTFAVWRQSSPSLCSLACLQSGKTYLQRLELSLLPSETCLSRPGPCTLTPGTNRE